MDQDQKKKWLEYHQYIQKKVSGHFNSGRFTQFGMVATRVVLKFAHLALRPFLRQVSKENVDIVVIGTGELDIKKSQHIWDHAQKMGYSVKCIWMSRKELRGLALKYRLPIQINTSSSYFLEHLFASYIGEKYSPKVTCMFHSYGLFPSQVRSFNTTGKTIYIPHSIHPVEYRYSGTDFDFFFVFGQGALENLKESDLRLGATHAVKVGSPFIQSQRPLAPRSAEKSILVLATSIIGSNEFYTKSFKIIVDWAMRDPDAKVSIKLHPLDQTDNVLKIVEGVPNISVLEKVISLADALENVSIVITTDSNAVLDAVLHQRPILITNCFTYDASSKDCRKNDSYLRIERFFPERATNAQELSDRIKNLLDNYDYYLEQCRKFWRFHLDTDDSAQAVCNVFESIISDSNEVKIEETYMPEELGGISNPSHENWGY